MGYKGHTKIELRDVNTGDVKVYEDDNMFTNALQKMLDFCTKHSMGMNPLNYYASHWSTFLGGLVLFDTALSDDADDFYPHAGVRAVGYGGVSDPSSYTDFTPWGIFNTQESDLDQTDTKVMVWDFSTSHANGTIACVCLIPNFEKYFGLGYISFCNAVVNQQNVSNFVLVGSTITQTRKGKQTAEGNQIGYGVIGSSLSTTDGSYVDFCIDEENDLKYMFKVCGDGLSIIYHSMTPENFDVFRGSNYYQSYTEETYSETFADSGYFCHFYNTDEKVLYFWIRSETNTGSTNSFDYYIHKFDMTSKTLTKNWKRVTQSSVSNFSFFRGLVITNNAAYYCGYSNPKHYICKYSFSTGTITNMQIGVPDGYFDGYSTCYSWEYILNGLIYFCGCIKNKTSNEDARYTLMLDTSSDTFLYTSVPSRNPSVSYSSYYSYAHMVPPIDNTQCIFGTGFDANRTISSLMTDMQGSIGTSAWMDSTKGQNMFMPLNFLATKNNLSEPIVKTATQTMKVTYTITAEEEE